MHFHLPHSHKPPWMFPVLLLALAVYGPGPDCVHARSPDPDMRSVSAEVLEDRFLTLVGTAVVQNPHDSVAVIEDLKNRQQRLLHEGDRAGRILIKKILRDQVVIDAGNGETRVKIGAGMGERSEVSTARSERITASTGNAIGSREGRYSIDYTAARAAFADPGKVLDNIDITPGRLFNRKRGFRIAAFDAGSILSEIGLRSGDLVLGINDQEITGPEQAVSVFKAIADGGEIDLEVRRRARTVHIRLQVH